MKTGLKHLPEQKQQELENIVHIIKKGVDVEMIILFGSYARGDWVEELDEEGVYYRYQSDFDILVLVDDRKLAKKWRVWDQIEDDVRRSGFIKTPASIISENLHGINHKLKSGHYFYSDIKKEGILLYDSGRHELAEERKMSPEERRKKAEKDRFELLRKAYVDARYDKNYTISDEELQWLGERVNVLQKMTEDICRGKIESFNG